MNCCYYPKPLDEIKIRSNHQFLVSKRYTYEASLQELPLLQRINDLPVKVPFPDLSTKDI
jgi:hypothetical protein